MTRTKAFSRVLALTCILTVTLAGCTNFFYNRLDTLATWYIQDLVALDDSQRNDLRAWLNTTLQWHRRSELVRYAKFARDLSETAQQSASTSTYQGIERQLQEFGSRLVERAAPDAARLLMSLTPEQIDELEANLAEKSRERNQKKVEALASGKWHEQRAKSIEKQLKRWTGAVTKEQRQLIAQLSGEFHSTTTDWLESQARWRQAMFGALRARFTADQSPADVEERILALLRTPEAQWTRAYLDKSTQNRQQSLSVLSAIDASLTAPQREHLRRELIQWAERLEAMIER